MAEQTVRFETREEQKLTVEDLETQGWVVLHVNHYYKSVGDGNGAAAMVFDYGEVVATDNDTRPSMDGVDWKDEWAKASTDTAKIDVLARRLKLK